MKKTLTKDKKIAETFRNDPVAFIEHIWPDAIVWDKLRDVSNAIAQNRRVIIPSGHGVGKTWLLARLALWFLTCFYPSKVITTAPTWPQVENLLWSEIRTAHRSATVDLGGRLLTTDLKIDDEWFAVGFSTRGRAAERDFGTPKFQGYHSPNLLVLLDEGPGVEHEIWVSCKTLIVGGNNKIISAGNPTSPTGDFYDACKSPLWKKIEISSFDHPNVKQNEILVPGAVTKEWINDMREEWGEDSPLWYAKVLGKFPIEGDDTLIPLAWAEACVGLDLPSEGEKRLGVDVARYGSDKTSLCSIFGQCVAPIEVFSKKDTGFTAGRAFVLNTKHKYDRIGVDDTGVGGGVTDNLRNDGLDVFAFNAGGKPIEDEKFDNATAEAWWTLREVIQKQQISLPDDKDLINQLCTRKYKWTRKGKIAVESKDEMRKRGLKSPDKADSLAIAMYSKAQGRGPVATVISVGDDDDDDI